jgi:hypothetical protein
MKKSPYYTTVSKLQFNQFNGMEFERLCFAFFSKIHPSFSFQWLGESGKDKGRDIWGENKNGRTICIQCSNYGVLDKRKVISDIKKLKRGNTIPNRLLVVCGGKVSNSIRDNIRKEAESIGVDKVETISGCELEEKMRKNGEAILKRFFHGEVFPEAPDDLRRIAFEDGPIIGTVTKKDLNEVEIALFSINRNRMRLKIILKKNNSIPCPLWKYNCWIYTPITGLISDVHRYSVAFNKRDEYTIPEDYDIALDERIYLNFSLKEKCCTLYELSLVVEWIDIVTGKKGKLSINLDLIYHDKGKGTYCSGIQGCEKGGNKWIKKFDIKKEKQRLLNLYSNIQTSQGFWRLDENDFSRDVLSKFKGHYAKILC